MGTHRGEFGNLADSSRLDSPVQVFARSPRNGVEQRRMQRLYLIDTMYFIFRAFYAVPALSAPCGSPTNAVHGVLGLLRNLWQTERFSHAVAVFESTIPTFRKEMDSDYKANRKPAPVELRSQVAMVRVACECLGINTLHVDGYEADDVIGTLARHAVDSNRTVTIVSNDKDLAQLLAISKFIELLRSGKKGRPERITREEVEDLYGVPPQLITSWLAMRGDPSDNIKGVPGIGQKTATKLLKEHGHIETLLSEPEKAGRFAKHFRDGRKQVLHDLDLATIRTDVDLGPGGFPENGFAIRPIDGAEQFFKELGMKGPLNRVRNLDRQEATLADLWR